jgi:2'-5' RNA ligase
VFLSKVNVFPDVIFIQVYDDGKIGELNKELQLIREVKKLEFDYPNFLPHISVAQFQNDRGFARLINCLEETRDVELGTLTVNSIELAIAHLRKKYPKLETLHTFKLK